MNLAQHVLAGRSIIAAFWTGGAPADALARNQLARYKQPRDYIPLATLPRTATGKVNRRALRDQYSKDRP